MTPTNISTRATEMPSLIEMTLATRANPIQADATNHTFSICALLPSRVSHPGSARAGESTLLTAHPGLIRSHQHRCGSGGIIPPWQTPLPSDDENVARLLWTVKYQWRGETPPPVSISTASSGGAYWRVLISRPAWRTAHAVVGK